MQILASFVTATHLARQLGKRVAREPQLAGAWERVTRVQAILATKLRLTPRGRSDPKIVGRHLRQHQPGIDDAIAVSGVDLDDD